MSLHPDLNLASRCPSTPAGVRHRCLTTTRDVKRHRLSLSDCVFKERVATRREKPVMKVLLTLHPNSESIFLCQGVNQSILRALCRQRRLQRIDPSHRRLRHRRQQVLVPHLLNGRRQSTTTHDRCVLCRHYDQTRPLQLRVQSIIIRKKKYTQSSLIFQRMFQNYLWKRYAYYKLSLVRCGLKFR